MGRGLLPEILFEQSVFEVGDRWAPDWISTKSASYLHFLRQEIGALQLRNLQPASCLLSEMEGTTETWQIASLCLL